MASQDGMNIALMDLNHTTRGVHTNTVPLALGLISRYLKQEVNDEFDIRIFKDLKKVLDTLKSWRPDVLGIAQYVWNSRLNLHVAGMISETNPECLIVAGGPNLEHSIVARTAFLREHRFVDVCVAYDGEIPFAEIVRRLLLDGGDKRRILESPVAGSYCLHPSGSHLVESPDAPPRLDSLDVFGAVYAEGVFDEFLENGFHPFVQTHRGCPFTCAFCHTSDTYYSEMLFQSPEIFRRDMEYLGERFGGQENVPLYIANTNMSLFEQDFDIAEVIREVQARYGWPKLINVNSGKNSRKLLKMLSVIDFQPAIALQTLTPEVLRNIGRKNIPFKEFTEFQKEVSEKTGRLSSTELILSLPGETKESFLRTVSAVVNSNIQNIVIYTLMNLKGTPVSSEEMRSRFGTIIKHRVVPRQFSDVEGRKIIETEEVVVGTDSMPYEDYQDLRGLSFVIKIFFSSAELVPLKKLLAEVDLDLGQWVSGIHRNLSRGEEIRDIYMEFMSETEAELFPTREALVHFFDRPENWDALVTGRLGGNLLRKYMRMVLYDTYDAYLEIAVSEARQLAQERFAGSRFEMISSMLDSIRLFLSTRGVKQIIEEGRFAKATPFCLDFDIPSWLEGKSPNGRLEDFRGSFRYLVAVSQGTEGWLTGFSSLNRDATLSLENLYHEDGIQNLWPTWVPCEKRVLGRLAEGEGRE